MSKIPYTKALTVFKKHHQQIPLEIYGSDQYKTLVSTLLSARTRDETTYKICEMLFKKAHNFNELANIPINHLKKIIHPVNFYEAKAKNLSRTASLIVKHYDSRIPNTFNELIKLPGIGRKTANLVLSHVFGKQAISVDTHVHKIANLMDWVHTKTPEQTELELMKVIPKKRWSEINRLFVSIGRQFRSERKLLEFLKSNGLTNKNH